MVVALGALQRGAEPDRGRRIHAVDDLVEAALFRHRACLHIRGRAAVEPGGNAGVLRGTRQQVTGDLVDRELIKRHVCVKGIHHPVAIRPEVAEIVPLVPVGVGVAGEIEPHPCPPHAKLFAREEPVDEPSVGIGGAVSEKRGHRFRAGRQTGQIEGETADERFWGSLVSKTQTLDGVACGDQLIEHVTGRGRFSGAGVPLGWHVGPVRGIRRRWPDPASNNPGFQLCLFAG